MHVISNYSFKRVRAYAHFVQRVEVNCYLRFEPSSNSGSCCLIVRVPREVLKGEIDSRGGGGLEYKKGRGARRLA